MNSTSVAAVLWDMDGTLVNTEPYWIEAEMSLARRDGGTWTHDDALSIVGFDLRDAAAQLQARAGVQGTATEIIEYMLDFVATQIRENGVPWRPGAHELLSAVRERNVPCALVTMSYASLANVIVEALPAGTFATVVTGDNVTNGKPHPEPYLTAARELAVDIEKCVAVEDSVTGLTSALASGARTIAVRFMVNVPAREGLSRLDSLEGFTFEELEEVASGKVFDRL